MINVQNLSMSYENNQQVLDNFSLKVPKGSVFALVGTSGCGKSTVLKILAGIYKNYSGIVNIDGKQIDPKKIRIGYVPQNYGLLEWKSVYENCILGLKIKNETTEMEKLKRNSILEKLELVQMLDRLPSQLSGGQRQRVALARAFLMNAEVLLMDEPFSALDAITREDMQKLFNMIWSANKVTTIFVTHSIDEALSVASLIGVMSAKSGQIMQVIENPLFGLTDIQNDGRYFALSNQLRKYVAISNRT